MRGWLTHLLFALAFLTSSCAEESWDPPAPSTRGSEASSRFMALQGGHLFFALGSTSDTQALYTLSTNEAVLGHAPHLVASGEVAALAADADTWFWGGQSGLMSIPRAGGPIRRVPHYLAPWAIAGDAPFVYTFDTDAARHDTLVEWDTRDGSSRVVAPLWGIGLAVDDTHLYAVTCVEQGGVWRVPRAGGPQEVLVQDTFCPTRIALDARHACYQDSTATTSPVVYCVAKDGGSPDAVTGAEAFALRDGHIFALDGVDVVDVDIATHRRRVIGRASNPEWPQGIAVDGQQVYYLNNGRVYVAAH